jgi:hypothetical protein
MNTKQQQMLQKITKPMQNASMHNINPKISTLHIQNKYQATTNISPSTTDATTNLKPYTLTLKKPTQQHV